MSACLCLWLLIAFTQSPVQPNLGSLFDHGMTFGQFLDTAKSQRELWLKNVSASEIPPDLIARMTRVASGLQLLVVAEDWCPDSVNTVPYVARLADAAHIDLRILDRARGAPAMRAHRTSDGRTATPTIVLLRGRRDVGAWIERPAILQQLFRAMATDPDAARRFADRQIWYDNDRGRTVLGELVTLAERTAVAR